MMKRLHCVLAALLVAGSGLLNAQYRTTLQDLDDSEAVRALKEHVATLSAAQMEGRKAGSEGEKMAAEYLEAKRLLKFLDYFLSYPSEDVPNNSILREFIGGSCFDV